MYSLVERRQFVMSIHLNCAALGPGVLSAAWLLMSPTLAIATRGVMNPELTEDNGDDVAQYRGVIAIEWPAATRPGPYSSMAGCLLVITDLVTGKQIMTCSHADVTVHADAAALVTADLVLFADADGEPLLDGKPETDDDENIRTGVFPFLVGEICESAPGCSGVGPRSWKGTTSATPRLPRE